MVNILSAKDAHEAASKIHLPCALSAAMKQINEAVNSGNFSCVHYSEKDTILEGELDRLGYHLLFNPHNRNNDSADFQPYYKISWCE